MWNDWGPILPQYTSEHLAHQYLQMERYMEQWNNWMSSTVPYVTHLPHHYLQMEQYGGRWTDWATTVTPQPTTYLRQHLPQVEQFGQKEFQMPATRSQVVATPVSLGQQETSAWQAPKTSCETPLKLKQMPVRQMEAALPVAQDRERLDASEGIASAAAALSSISATAMPADSSAASRIERKRKAPAVSSASDGKTPGIKSRRTVQAAIDELLEHTRMRDKLLLLKEPHPAQSLHAQLSLLQRLDSLKKQEAPPRWDSAPPASSSAAVAEGRRKPRGRWNDSAAPSSRGRPLCEGVGQSGEQPTFLRLNLACPAGEPSHPQPRRVIPNPAAHGSTPNERMADLILECAASIRSSRTCSPSNEDEEQPSIGVVERSPSPHRAPVLATAIRQ
mmetsp:Transcript_33866/g.84396  ORF Transcript_33866/g.84396 Transcript_33866/m.84396 type:complete len:390 (+) Transcript_33866:13-1182(+)